VRALIFGLLVGCATTYRAGFTAEPANIDTSAPFLKCHTKDGRVYVLQGGWHVDAGAGIVTGTGIAYDADRNPGPVQRHVIMLSEVALFETNHPESVPRGEYAVLAVVTAASVVLTALCLSNPKACFGSCPTFYASDGTNETLQAEGFSASIARVFEATDVDHLWSARPMGRTFDVLMTNEALETHAVDRVRLGRAVGASFAPATRISRRSPRARRRPATRRKARASPTSRPQTIASTSRPRAASTSPKRRRSA
jgi:hypothetical protein